MTAIPTDKESLDYLGEFLMTHLRDSALDQFEGVANGHWKAPGLKRLQSEVAEMTDAQRDVLRRCVVNAVDTGIHDFLFKIQEEADFEGRVRLAVDGKAAEEISDGLHGEIFTKDGWGARFSKHGEPRS